MHSAPASWNARGLALEGLHLCYAHRSRAARDEIHPHCTVTLPFVHATRHTRVTEFRHYQLCPRKILMHKRRGFSLPTGRSVAFSVLLSLALLLTGLVTPARPALAAESANNTYLPLLMRDADPSWPADRVSIDVEWGDDVTLVDQPQMDLLKEIDLENHTYTFDAQGVADSGLDLSVGNILVIYNTSLRRITSVQQEGADLVVETEYAALTEAVKNGTLDWDVGIEFDPSRIVEASISGQSIQPNEDGTIEFKYTDGPFVYHLKMVMQKESAAIDFTVTKGVTGSASAKLTAQGTIQRFRSNDTIIIRNHQLQEYDHALDNMTGDLTLGLVMAASGNDAVNLQLPVVLLKYPVVVGMVPVVLNVKVQFVVNASVPAAGSSQVKANFIYDSDLGFRYNGTEVVSGGRLGAVTFGEEIAQTGAPGAIAANFGMGYPRVELGIFGETIVPWAQTAFLIGGTYTFFPACQTAEALFLGAAGINLKFFGISADLGSKTFFEEKKELLRAGNCP